MLYLIVNSNSTSVGGKHLVSSQTINSTLPLIEKGGSLFNLTDCLKVALFSKYLICISKTGSLTVSPLPSRVFPFLRKFPLFSKVNTVGTGPSSGTF